MNSIASTFTPPSMRDVARKTLLAHLRRKRVGDRLPPIKQLARELNVGESNLMAAMQQLRREGILYSRKRVGTYVARPASELTASGHGQPLLANKQVVLLHQATDNMILDMIGSAQRELQSQGATVAARDAMEDMDSWAEHCRGADAAIMFNPPTPGSWQHLHDLSGHYANLGCPLVVVSTAWSRGLVGGFDFDLVGIDQEEIGRLAGERMRRGGHRSACYVGRRIDGGTAYTPLSAARLRGFEAGLGAAIRKDHRINTLGYSSLSGGLAFQEYMALADRPRAVFAATDALAVGFWIGAAAQGLRAGVDFDLIGVDGLALGRQQTGGPLATIELPAEEMGRAGAALAASRITDGASDPQTQVLSCRMCEGVTIGPLKQPEQA